MTLTYLFYGQCYPIYHLTSTLSSLWFFAIISLLLPYTISTDHLDKMASCLPPPFNFCTDPRARCVKKPTSDSYYCTCGQGFKYDLFRCVQLKAYGQLCSDYRQCQYFDDNTTCDSTTPRTCTCRFGFSFEPSRNKCVPWKSIANRLPDVKYQKSSNPIIIPLIVILVILLTYLIRRTIKYWSQQCRQSSGNNQRQNNCNIIPTSPFRQLPQSVNRNQMIDPSPSNNVNTVVTSTNLDNRANYYLSNGNFTAQPNLIESLPEDEPPSYEEAVHGSISIKI